MKRNVFIDQKINSFQELTNCTIDYFMYKKIFYIFFQFYVYLTFKYNKYNSF